ncbi:putative copper-transporting ATPase HMA5 [Wickerhamiella sorbophila]|uniref:Putative copper-transporting ATPase HMA5 n=1 Tax=Wickerhamiella sorbophila TaxID=45607 RepID=A0A2T0FMS4_9ASCO|nr:putative copper-transporting ATPase HMA5 [Wickerhamiella sorbophila]PRT56298.1 putative copper-transporting ATPase HMA5 [Wickerhamiella sorbophila]
MLATHVITVRNIHCGSCEDDIRKIIQEEYPQAKVVFVGSDVVVEIPGSETFDGTAISRKLYERGFEVIRVDSQPFHSRRLSWVGRLFSGNTRHERHAAICEQCAHHEESEEPDHQPATETYRAVYSIQGMSCASCARSIDEGVRERVPEIKDISVDVMNHSVALLVPNALVADKVQEVIRDLGYECQLTELLPVSTTVEYIVEASLGGMTCSNCANSIKDTALGLAFVDDAKIDVLSGSGIFHISDESKVEDLKSAIEDSGYTFELINVSPRHMSELIQQSRTINIKVEGMFCEQCPQHVMDVLKSYGDAVEVVNSITLDEPYVKFTYVPNAPKFTIRQIIDKISRANPELTISFVRPQSIEELAAEHMQLEKREIISRLWLTGLISIPMTYFMIRMSTVHMSWIDNASTLVLATPVYFFADDMFHIKSIKELKGVLSEKSWSRRLFHFGSMNLLMSLGTSISYWASLFMFFQDSMSETYFDSVVFLTLFLLVGRYLDVYSKAKASSAVSSLNELCPDEVQLVVDGDTVTQPVYAIDVNDTVKVFSGQKAAVDGLVISGASEFDEAMLTGESLPVLKRDGNYVYAGTVNCGSEAVVVKVTAANKGTFLDGIMSAVRQGQMTTSPIERVAEQVTSAFVPVVTYLALFVWLVWYVLGRSGRLPDEYLEHSRANSWGVWSMEFAIAVFVVACPCGIGLAAPTALFVGSRLAAKYGILARGGGEAFQEGAALDIVCFDKTGTITEGGNPQITDVWFKPGVTPQGELVQLAARLESESVHPLAKAVVSYAADRELMTSRVENIRQIAGRGIIGQVSAGPFQGKRAIMGNERLIKEQGIESGENEKLEKWKKEGKSVILLALDGDVVALFAAQDTIRPEAKQVIHALQTRGISTWMISGDNLKTARAIAAQAGIPPDQVIAEVLPEEKAERVRWLQKTGKADKSHSGRAIVAMVGDGVNDAPSLSACDVGIAIGTGADITLQSAKFVLVRSDLRGVPIVIDLSAAVMNRVRLNFFWAAIYNIVMIPLAAGVFYPWTETRLNPVLASLAMALSSVSVVFSSLALQWFKPRID